MVLAINEFSLDKLDEIVDLPPGKAGFYLESCVWCLNQNNHQNGVILSLNYDNDTKNYPITWAQGSIDITKINQHYNIDDALPFGAEALAFYICLCQTSYSRVERSSKKTGIDYWLADKNYDPNLPFQNSGRLEVSGILKENEKNTVTKRINEKLKQSSRSDNSHLPVFIVVIAFDKPYAKMVVKNANS